MSSECETQHRILIIERESDAVSALRLRLAICGFAVEMLHRGEDVRTAVDRHHPHLVILDLDLPSVLALDLVRRISRCASPYGPRLLALSSHIGERHVVSSFDQGVDDYVVKPFSVAEVVARVRALLRPMRSAGADPPFLEFRELRMQIPTNLVTIADQTVSLRRMELQLLRFLMRRPERACSRESLLRGVWDSSSRARPRNVDRTVQRLRQALTQHGCGRYLQTIRKYGYRLSAADG